jgi:hypothetical protein
MMIAPAIAALMTALIAVAPMILVIGEAFIAIGPAFITDPRVIVVAAIATVLGFFGWRLLPAALFGEVILFARLHDAVEPLAERDTRLLRGIPRAPARLRAGASQVPRTARFHLRAQATKRGQRMTGVEPALVTYDAVGAILCPQRTTFSGLE